MDGSVGNAQTVDSETPLMLEALVDLPDFSDTMLEQEMESEMDLAVSKGHALWGPQSSHAHASHAQSAQSSNSGLKQDLEQVHEEKLSPSQQATPAASRRTDAPRHEREHEDPTGGDNSGIGLGGKLAEKGANKSARTSVSGHGAAPHGQSADLPELGSGLVSGRGRGGGTGDFHGASQGGRESDPMRDSPMDPALRRGGHPDRRQMAPASWHPYPDGLPLTVPGFHGPFGSSGDLSADPSRAGPGYHGPHGGRDGYQRGGQHDRRHDRQHEQGTGPTGRGNAPQGGRGGGRGYPNGPGPEHPGYLPPHCHSHNMHPNAVEGRHPGSHGLNDERGHFSGHPHPQGHFQGHFPGPPGAYGYYGAVPSPHLRPPPGPHGNPGGHMSDLAGSEQLGLGGGGGAPEWGVRPVTEKSYWGGKCAGGGGARDQGVRKAEQAEPWQWTPEAMMSFGGKSVSKPGMVVKFKNESGDKRRVDRNNREQKRSKKISDQIKELKQLLESSGVNTSKGNKSSVLNCAADFISELRRVNHDLQLKVQQDHQHQHQQKRGTAGTGPKGGGSFEPEGSRPPLCPPRPEGRATEPLSLTSGPCASGPNSGPNSVGGIGSGGFERGRVVSSRQLTTQLGAGVGAAQQELLLPESYELAFRDAGVPLAITSVDGRFLDCNWRFEVESGYSRAELVRITFFTLAQAPHPGQGQGNGQGTSSLFHSVAAMLKAARGEQQSKTMVLRAAVKKADCEAEVGGDDAAPRGAEPAQVADALPPVSSSGGAGGLSAAEPPSSCAVEVGAGAQSELFLNISTVHELSVPTKGVYCKELQGLGQVKFFSVALLRSNA